MKTTRMNLKEWILAGVILVMFQSSFAQELMDSLSQDENKIISSIAPYAADMRTAILNVSEYPQVLVKLERTQARTSQSFQDLISSYPRTEQEKFYEVVRFPELTKQLVDHGKQNTEEAKALIKDYPEGAQQPILDIYRDHFDDLARINSIYQSSQNTLEKITATYPSALQEDFKKVIASPDVMNLLTDNIDLTVSLGESYKADPNGVTQYLDSLNGQLAEQNTKDLDVYKHAVETDPKLQAEMKSAADEFAAQYDQQDTNPAYLNNNYYGSAPYPYWFGYPYWYGSPLWYPMPFYYHTGFYLGLNGGLIVTGLPSFAYTNWFFGHGYYSRYPMLYHHYNTYYNVHRNNIANVNVYRGFNGAVRNHFSPAYRSGGSTGRNRSFHGGTRSVENRTGNFNTRSNQLNIKPGNNSFNHFNANSFHSMGWQHMHTSSLRGRH